MFDVDFTSFDEDWRDGRFDKLHGDEDEIEALTDADTWEALLSLEADDIEEDSGITRYTFKDGSIMRITK